MEEEVVEVDLIMEISVVMAELEEFLEESVVALMVAGVAGVPQVVVPLPFMLKVFWI